MPQAIQYPSIPIFWNGTHKNRGAKKDWSADDVRTIFKATQDQLDEKIPFTIDHPTNDLPVIGWTDKNNLTLIDQGGKVTIEARPTQFSQEILEAIKATGRRKVSVALRSFDSSIRHIGLVEKPAVQDLPEIPFSESEEFEFCEMEADESLIPADPDEATPENNDLKTNTEANTMADIEKTPAPEMSHEFKAELDAATKERDELKLRLEAIEAEKRSLEFAAWLDRDEMKGKVVPAIRSKVLRLMNSLHGKEEYEFAEGDATVKKLPLDEFREVLEALPEAVTFGKSNLDPAAGSTELDDKQFEEFNNSRK